MLDVSVGHGDNITLYCDCKLDTGVYIVWFRNCSHENQPTLFLNVKPNDWVETQLSLHFKFLRNSSSNSYDLSIINITHSDEGSYYCGTKELKKEEKEYLTEKTIYRYSDITSRVTVYSTDLHPDINKASQDHDLCWYLLLSLCPAVSVVSAFLSSLLVYRLCQRTASKHQEDEERPYTKSQTRQPQDEDVCYAALEIHEASQSPKTERTTQSSDFSTYSTVKKI
ncbi:uncharacterized protein LOC133451316 isoform X1 [Cololabis saira]|uniref:uncharacterized protein LOC133451316 isoform X1 n=1 Tax=Cololabis saira TaxID=129043 RepID=UPI002AD5AD85|nr:uncharacterized protein LOC133451316 isoform X1 [Cololabis saira]